MVVKTEVLLSHVKHYKQTLYHWYIEISHSTVHSSFAWPLYFKEEFLSLHYQRIVNPQKCHEQKTHCLVIFSQFVCISKVFRTHYFSSMIRRTSPIRLWFRYLFSSNWNVHKPVNKSYWVIYSDEVCGKAQFYKCILSFP